MPPHAILITYALVWGLALVGNAMVEAARLRSAQGVAPWIDYAGFALTLWIVLPMLPIAAIVVSLQRRALRAGVRAGPAWLASPRD